MPQKTVYFTVHNNRRAIIHEGEGKAQVEYFKTDESFNAAGKAYRKAGVRVVMVPKHF